MADQLHAATVSVQDTHIQSSPLPKLDRLRTRADFQRLTRFGRPVDAADHLANGPTARVGFTASKKVGNAVARNRAKRRLRALAYAVLRPQAQPSLDYVLVGRHTTLHRPWLKLVKDLEEALSRTRLDKEHA